MGRVVVRSASELDGSGQSPGHRQTLRFLGPYEARGHAHQPGEQTSGKSECEVARDVGEALWKEGAAGGDEREDDVARGPMRVASHTSL
jgi:hypothetical protein